jgi:hypothetical protein
MQATILLQLSDYTDGGLLDAALADLAGAVGGQASFGLIVGSVLMLAFYLASSGSLATPATLTALSGGILIASLPPGYGTMAQVVIFLGLAAAVLAALNKYAGSGA